MKNINWQTILLALIASLPAALIAWNTHTTVNSRMTEMIQSVKKEASASGAAEQRRDTKIEQGIRDAATLKAREQDTPANSTPQAAPQASPK